MKTPQNFSSRVKRYKIYEKNMSFNSKLGLPKSKTSVLFGQPSTPSFLRNSYGRPFSSKTN